MKIDKYSAILGNTVGFHDMSTLTSNRPVASLPFGGKYRLIDFPLSSLANAGVRSVFGIFQQDNISSVFDHIRSGREWGLNTLLSHYYLGIYNTRVESSTVGKEYYQQLLTYLKRSGSNQTVSLNCDVLVNIDLTQVFHLHNTTKSPITVVYKKLPKKDISEVNAILDIDETDHVLSHKLFDKKAEQEYYNMSTDIFVVDTQWLIERLEEEAQKEHPEKLRYVLRDLAAESGAFAYEYTGYLANIHSVETYYQANIDMLDLHKFYSLFSPNQKIHTKVKNEEPTYYAPGCEVNTSQFASGSIVEGKVVRSVVSRNVQIHKDSLVKESIVFPRVVIGEGAQVEYAIIDKGAEVADGVVIRGTAENPVVIKKGEKVTEDILFMKILFVAAEGAPFSKTGGLGDVIGALPKSLVKAGHEVAVILPYYDMVEAKFGDQIEDVLQFEVYVGWRRQFCGIKKTVLNGVTFYFIDNQYYFFRGHVYGDFDDGERFAFFQLAALEAMERIGFIPDVLHAHDYHTAMIPFLLKEKYRWIQAYQNIKTVLTIHNLEFQGQFSEGMLWDLFRVGFERYADGTVRWNDCLNWMKAGILYADRVTTVSPSYAYEIMTTEFGCGLDQILRMESGKVSGIVNGIDTDLYNPETDPLLDYHFNKSDLSGKAQNKAKLQEKVGLPVRADVSMIGIVSRLTRQKGFDVVVEGLHRMLQEDVQIVLLGTGDPGFEQAFSWFSQVFPDKLSANITFDVKLAQEIYAACDIFLMPSRFEPCGLSQMMAMRYGTLPLVHEVGGLRDTVQPFNPIEGTGTGFSFNNLTPYWLNWALQTALDVYYNHPDVWKNMQVQAMECDFSWDTACKSYLDLYHSLSN